MKIKYAIKDRAHGLGEWEFVDLGDVDWSERPIHEYIEDEIIHYFDRENEGYRGFEFEIIEHFPKEYIEQQIVEREKSLIAIKDAIVFYKNMLIEEYGENKMMSEIKVEKTIKQSVTFDLSGENIISLLKDKGLIEDGAKNITVTFRIGTGGDYSGMTLDFKEEFLKVSYEL